MNPFVQAVVAIGVVASTVALAATARELRQLRVLLKSGRVRVQTHRPPLLSSTMAHIGGAPGGHAVFMYRQDRWVLESDLSQAGYEAVPPRMPGSFEGQVVKTDSGRRR